ncbi:hypothetical protein HY086_01015 [Candidatus Gottesmanbacteria bacterium]|nr:hypothetical protein [Candidatus Gottesmanbacteria bacterium]
MKKILKTLIFLLVFLLSRHSAFAALGDAEIRGNFDGSDIVIKTTARLAGAIDSLTWKGKEFVYSKYHGEQIQYAWSLDNQGECNNPTEAGSATDDTGHISSSILQELTINATNQLFTVSLPAFWLPPDYPASVFCPSGLSKAVNTTVVSNHTLKKTVTIGSQNLNNVIEFRSEIVVPQSTKEFIIEAPTGYHTVDFSNYWTYHPQTNTLTNVTSLLKNDPNIPDLRFYPTNLPVILSTVDGNYAIGVYAPDIDGFNSGSRQYQLFGFALPFTKWNVTYHLGPNIPKTYNFLTYLAIGSFTQVKTALSALYQKQPAILESPIGTIDVADCNIFAGWSGYLGEETRTVPVSFYLDGSSSEGKFIGSISTDKKRERAVCQALNGGTNCEVCPADQPQCIHGFSLRTPASARDGKTHAIYAYAAGIAGRSTLLVNSPKMVSCPAVLFGDIDGNSKVDIFDYNILVGNFSKTGVAGFTSADIDNNGKVDIFDYNILVGNFGK